MSDTERRDLPSGSQEIPIITEDFLQEFHRKFPTQESRHPVIVEMDRQLHERQPDLYRFTEEEAVRALRVRVPLDRIREALGRVKYPLVDIYTVLTEQKQFNEGAYSPNSIPDVGRIVTVTSKAIDTYGRYDDLYKKRMTEGKGEVIGPLGRMLTHTHVNNPILFDRVRQLLGSAYPEYRIAATTSLAMLSAIAIQARQTPFHV